MRYILIFAFGFYLAHAENLSLPRLIKSFQDAKECAGEMIEKESGL